MKSRIADIFPRAETRASAGAFIDGVLSGIERKTGWLLAEQAGLDKPYRMQSLLGRSTWAADGLRDVVRSYAIEALGSSDGVLVVDGPQDGFIKKGDQSAGVARQYTGTAGRIETAQVGVFLAYASQWGQALIDRRLYLPESWTDDAGRRQKCQIPEEVEFATKIEIARGLIAAALDAGVPCRWVLADALWGSASSLRRMLEDRHQPYVLAVRSNHHLRLVNDQGLVQTDPKIIADEFPPESWTKLAAGEGSKGFRLYDWARVALHWVSEQGFERYVLFHRSRRDPEQLAFYLVYAPAGTPLAELAGAAGLRWTIEECFQRAKDDLGLDHCEARSWHGWHRHMTLVMAAAAFLARLAAGLRRDAKSKPNETSPMGQAAA